MTLGDIIQRLGSKINVVLIISFIKNSKERNETKKKKKRLEDVAT